MPRGSERHMFAGGNTSLGFYSHYDHIVPYEPRRIILLKGGPGVGKSTLMRHVGNHMQDLGYDVEYFHCSSDPDSLDGIRIIPLEVILIDGTAPHVVDPQNPGAVDEIIHLGDFWNEPGITKQRAAIKATNAKVGQTFCHTYRYLAAAKSIYDDIESANQENFNYGLANEIAASLLLRIFGHRPVTADVGKARHLFASALTPSGAINYLTSLVEPMEHKYILTGSPGTGKSTVVQKIVEAAVERGLYVEAYHCALDPVKYEHAIIPALRTAIVTSVSPHFYAAPGATITDMDLCRHPASVLANANLITEDQRVFQNLLDIALDFLKTAKRLHDELETYYVPYMDFSAITALRGKLLERIMAYAKESAR